MFSVLDLQFYCACPAKFSRQDFSLPIRSNGGTVQALPGHLSGRIHQLPELRKRLQCLLLALRYMYQYSEFTSGLGGSPAIRRQRTPLVSDAIAE
jgi:hypothetical protein